jgi:hypothetical protein
MSRGVIADTTTVVADQGVVVDIRSGADGFG